MPNPKYDGQFTFVRLRYGPRAPRVSQQHALVARLPGRRAALHADPERAQPTCGPKTAETSILGLDDPELFALPVAYMAEPGFWTADRRGSGGVPRVPAEGRVRHLRRFRREPRRLGRVRRPQMQRVLPGGRGSSTSTPTHPIFHSFFEIDVRSISCRRRTTSAGRSSAGCSKTTIRRKRLMAMINFNTDISEYWECSRHRASGRSSETNEAYKLGVNYVMYGMTH